MSKFLKLALLVAVVLLFIVFGGSGYRYLGGATALRRTTHRLILSQG